MRKDLLPGLLLLPLAAAACSPKVQVQGGDKPIVIDLNVKIEQTVRVQVDKQLDSLIKSDPSLF